MVVSEIPPYQLISHRIVQSWVPTTFTFNNYSDRIIELCRGGMNDSIHMDIGSFSSVNADFSVQYNASVF